MNTIIEEQKLLLVDERERSNQFEEQMKLLQKSVKFLERVRKFERENVGNVSKTRRRHI